MKYYAFALGLILGLVGCSHKNTTTPAAAVPTKVNYTNAAQFNVQLGVGYLDEGNIERSKEKLLLALEQNPRYPLAHAAMAYYWERTGDYKLAEESYRRALALAPQEGEIQNNYGAFLCRHGQYTQAENYFIKAAQNTKYINTATAYENAGVCAMSQNDVVHAREYFQKALQQDNLRERSLYELTLLLHKAGQDEEAYRYAQRLISLQTAPKNIIELAIELANKYHDQTNVQAYDRLLKAKETN